MTNQTSKRPKMVTEILTFWPLPTLLLYYYHKNPKRRDVIYKRALIQCCCRTFLNAPSVRNLIIFYLHQNFTMLFFKTGCLNYNSIFPIFPGVLWIKKIKIPAYFEVHFFFNSTNLLILDPEWKHKYKF